MLAARATRLIDATVILFLPFFSSTLDNPKCTLDRPRVKPLLFASVVTCSVSDPGRCCLVDSARFSDLRGPLG